MADGGNFHFESGARSLSFMSKLLDEWAVNAPRCLGLCPRLDRLPPPPASDASPAAGTRTRE